MWLCNVGQQKCSNSPPCRSLLRCNLLCRWAQSRGESPFTSGLMTSCPQRFQEHPSSSEKWSRKRGMKNEADRWSLQLLAHFDAADGEASHKSFRSQISGNRCWSKALRSERSADGLWMINLYLRALSHEIKSSSQRKTELGKFALEVIWHGRDFHFLNVGSISSHSLTW